MGMTCTVCNHPQRKSIDSLIALGTPSQRVIARQFNLHQGAIDRHKRSGHLGIRVEQAVERSQAKDSDDFLDSLKLTIAHGNRGLALGMEAMDMGCIEPQLAYKLGPAYGSMALKAAELVGQATGRLNQAQGAAQTGNVYISVVLPRQIATEPAAIDVKVLPEPED